MPCLGPIQRRNPRQCRPKVSRIPDKTVNYLLTSFNRVKDEVKASGGSIQHEYTLFQGFSATLPEVHALTLKNHPHIDGIEEDKEVTIQ